MQRDIITSTITWHLRLVGSNNFGEHTSFSPFTLIMLTPACAIVVSSRDTGAVRGVDAAVTATAAVRGVAVAVAATAAVRGVAATVTATTAVRGVAAAVTATATVHRIAVAVTATAAVRGVTVAVTATAAVVSRTFIACPIRSRLYFLATI